MSPAESNATDLGNTGVVLMFVLRPILLLIYRPPKRFFGLILAISNQTLRIRWRFLHTAYQIVALLILPISSRFRAVKNDALTHVTFKLRCGSRFD